MRQEADKSVTETAKQLGISGSSLRRWINYGARRIQKVLEQQHIKVNPK